MPALLSRSRQRVGEHLRYRAQRASTSGASVGGVLYGNNYPPDSDYNKWPAEAGWWGMYVYITASQIQKFLLQTDSCGNIITKEPYSS